MGQTLTTDKDAYVHGVDPHIVATYVFEQALTDMTFINMSLQVLTSPGDVVVATYTPTNTTTGSSYNVPVPTPSVSSSVSSNVSSGGDSGAATFYLLLTFSPHDPNNPSADFGSSTLTSSTFTVTAGGSSGGGSVDPTIIAVSIVVPCVVLLMLWWLFFSG
jgi:hypothetical protein